MTKILLGLLCSSPGTGRAPVDGDQAPLAFSLLPVTAAVSEVDIIPDAPGIRSSPSNPLQWAR